MKSIHPWKRRRPRKVTSISSHGYAFHLHFKLTDQPAHRPGFCQDSAIECRYLEEQGDLARIPVVRRSIAYEIQIRHSRYPKSDLLSDLPLFW